MARTEGGAGTRLVMRALILAAGLAVAALSPAVAQQATQSAPIKRNELQFDFVSKQSNRTYRIWVARPSVPPPPEGYPVLYLTDAPISFRQAADAMLARQLVDLRPAVIVGIGYPSDELWDWVRLRNRDLIPTPPNDAFRPVFRQWGKSAGYGQDADAGGAELFYRFLVEELQPRIAGMERVDKADQSYWGHSLGGLFGLHLLFNHPDAFRSFIISSPTIGWNMREILQGEGRFRSQVEGGKASPRVLLVAGSLENFTSSQMAVASDEEALRLVRMGRQGHDTLADRLRAMAGKKGFVVESHEFEGENHLSVIPASISRGMTFALGRIE
jgi:predicted alpha/beta superfamily hydrolase